MPLSQSLAVHLRFSGAVDGSPSNPGIRMKHLVFRLERANKSAGSVIKPNATIVTCLDSTGDSGLESPVFLRIPLV
jgi:hypothetical protein